MNTINAVSKKSRAVQHATTEGTTLNSTVRNNGVEPAGINSRFRSEFAELVWGSTSRRVKSERPELGLLFGLWSLFSA